MKSHDTAVIGLNEKGEVSFLKTYNYPIEMDEAQADVMQLIDKNKVWWITNLSGWKLINQEDEAFKINLPKALE